MSEVQTRPAAPRGRGSARGGRGGFSTRGGRGGRSGHATNGEKADDAHVASVDDDSEVGQLKKKYGSKVDTIKDFFPGWTDEDAVMALEETDGNLESTVERITTGTITQWGEVSKNKKDKSKSKAKEGTNTSPLTDFANTRNSRGGRGAFDSSRGSRGRGSDRGRGGARGGRGASAAHTNGSRIKENPSVPVEEAWETAKPESVESKPAADDSWDKPAPSTVEPAPEPETSIVSSIIPEGVKKSWASLLHQEPKKAPVPVEKPVVEEIKPIEPIEAPTPEEPVPVEEPVSEPLPEVPVEITPVATPAYEPEPVITPSKDALTETNLEQVLDTSNPPPTATAASTAASSWDPHNTAASNSYSSLQQQPAARTPASGFAATALKATAVGARSASFQRRVLDQEEAVRMPGNREVDRTTVQFGAFNLNGSGDEDIDGDREEPETRAQPPLHSPVAPRASLPPAPQPQVPVPESQPSPLSHARTSLPVSQPTSAPGLPSPQGLPNVPNTSQQGPQGTQAYGQYNQYGSAGAQQEQPNQKYEAFAQQAQQAQQAPSSQSPFEGHPSQQAQSQAPPQQPQSTFASAPGEYPYYASEQQRNNYQSYYGAPYSQQSGGLSQPEGAPGLQQRTASGFNGTQNETSSQYPPASAPQSQSRYATAGEPQTSGHSTPNPVTQAQQQQPPVAPGQSQHQPQNQAGGYQYSHPYYSSPYYAQYANQQQYQQGYGQGGYGAPYGKGGIYSQPHAGYGMSPQTPYDHTSSPAAGSFGQSSLHGRDSAVGGGLGDYGRGAASAQTSTPQGLGSSASGAFGMHDTFGRNTSYQGQGQNQHYGQQATQPSVGDELKPFGDSKSANGPSPSLSQANRPTSAANNGLGQTTLPPPQGSQQGYGGYPSHLQQQHALHGSQNNSQYGGLGVGHQAAVGQTHQGSTYGQYPSFGGSYYGGNGQQRGGWGGNYGH